MRVILLPDFFKRDISMLSSGIRVMNVSFLSFESIRTSVYSRPASFFSEKNLPSHLIVSFSVLALIFARFFSLVGAGLGFWLQESARHTRAVGNTERGWNPLDM